MTQIVDMVINRLAQIKMTCPPSLIKTATRITVANPVGQALIRRMVRLGAPLISQANVGAFQFPDRRPIPTSRETIQYAPPSRVQKGVDCARQEDFDVGR
jgi:hypothetical protein